jgi:hypothetical protein
MTVVTSGTVTQSDFMDLVQYTRTLRLEFLTSANMNIIQSSEM